MRQIADRVLVIFPFEEAIYREAGVEVQWVGHPLLDVAQLPAPRDAFLTSLGLDPRKPVVALLPGSRHTAPRDPAESCPRRVPRPRSIPDAQFVVARAPPGRRVVCAARAPAWCCHRRGRADDVLAAADVALVASGP